MCCLHSQMHHKFAHTHQHFTFCTFLHLGFLGLWADHDFDLNVSAFSVTCKFTISWTQLGVERVKKFGIKMEQWMSKKEKYYWSNSRCCLSTLDQTSIAFISNAPFNLANFGTNVMVQSETSIKLVKNLRISYLSFHWLEETIYDALLQNALFLLCRWDLLQVGGAW